MNIDAFFETNIVGVNRLFVIVYSNLDDSSKRFRSKRYYLPKDIIKNYNIIINGKNFYDQEIDYDIKRYEEYRKLTTGKGDDYTAGCLSDYDHIKNHYKLRAIHLSRQSKLDADPKTIR